MHASTCARGSGFLVGLLTLVTFGHGCGFNLSGGSNRDTLPSAIATTENGEYELIATRSSDADKWLFIVKPRQPAPAQALRFEWDFGDGERYEGSSLSHSFTAGGTYTITVTAYDSNNRVVFVLSLELEVPAPNGAPAANAGENLSVLSNESVFLDGSDSYDAEGDELSFLWTQVAGPPVFLHYSDTVSPSFVAPTVDDLVQLVFSLEVSDGTYSGQDTVTVDVSPYLGPAGTDELECSFTLTGDGASGLNAPRPLTVTATAVIIGSFSPSDALTWTVDGVPETNGVNSSASKILIFSAAGIHTIALSLTVGGTTLSCVGTLTGSLEEQVVVWPTISGSVKDDEGSAIAGATVAANAGGTTSVTDATGNYKLHVPYQWTGSVTAQHTDYAFTPSSQSLADVEGDVAGQRFTGTSRTDTPSNNPPIADAGADQVLIDDDGDGREQVQLDGSGSYDPDGEPLRTYTWRNTGGVELSSEPAPILDLPVGVHSLALFVVDAAGATAGDTVMITVVAGGSNENLPPIADAGPNQTLTDGDANGFESVSLNGSGSYDPDNEPIVAYRWSDGSGAEIANRATASVLLSVGSHLLTLTVSDAAGATGSDNVLVTIQAPEPTGNLPPVANAGQDQFLIDENEDGLESVTLNGTLSRDPDGQIVSYRWRTASGQLLLSQTQGTVSLPRGTHTITLTVTDDQAATGADAVIVSIAAPTPPGNYYVDMNHPLASDANPGSEALPFATLQRAANAVGPGDTVYVKNGTYTASNNQQGTPVMRITTSGTAERPITFKAFPGHKPLVNARLSTTGTPLQYPHRWGIIVGRNTITDGTEGIAVAHVVIDGFTATGAITAGIEVNGGINGVVTRYVTVRNCEAFGNTGGGVWARGTCEYLLFENLHIHDNYLSGIAFRYRSKEEQGAQPVDQRWATRYSTIRNCLVYNNVEPVQAGNTDGITMGFAYKCTLKNNVSFMNSDDGLDIYASNECLVDGNVAFYHRHPDGDGNGIKACTGGGGRHLIVNNVSFENKLRGFDVAAPNSYTPNYGNQFYHNLAYLNTRWGYMVNTNPDALNGVPHFLRNNLALDNDLVDQGTGGDDFKFNGLAVDSDYNRISVHDKNLGNQSGLERNSITLDPLFTNQSLVIDTAWQGSTTATLSYIRQQVRQKFGLQPTTPLRNRGILVSSYHCPRADDNPSNPMDPNAACGHWTGSAPDIGPFSIGD